MKVTFRNLSLSIMIMIIVAACSTVPITTPDPSTPLKPTLTPEPTPTKMPLERPPSLEGSRVRNIILFIGDGMGETHRTAATWISQGQEGSLVMDELEHSGWSMTRNAWDQVTDSAAGATALATGVKTANSRIGVDAGGESLVTILERAKSLGMATGLITTVAITHATPAAFVAHTQNGDDEIEIAAQIIDAGVNVLMGGGEDFLSAVSNQ